MFQNTSTRDRLNSTRFVYNRTNHEFTLDNVDYVNSRYHCHGGCSEVQSKNRHPEMYMYPSLVKEGNCEYAEFLFFVSFFVL